MFRGMRFGAPYFVWYGKDGAASTDNADRYVYAVSNDGSWENGDDYVLGRVSRTKLSHLSAADWSFYRAGDGMADTSWTSKIDEARPVLARPLKCGMTGMTYITALHRYVMVLWHVPRESLEQDIKEQVYGTTLEFFEAPKPWGPWSRVKAFETGASGWYTPIIGQRFQVSVDRSAVRAILYASGGGYKLNYMTITLSTIPLPHNDPAFVGAR
jgi:hypothetical protein